VRTYIHFKPVRVVTKHDDYFENKKDFSFTLRLYHLHDADYASHKLRLTTFGTFSSCSATPVAYSDTDLPFSVFGNTKSIVHTGTQPTKRKKVGISCSNVQQHYKKCYIQQPLHPILLALTYALREHSVQSSVQHLAYCI